MSHTITDEFVAEVLLELHVNEVPNASKLAEIADKYRNTARRKILFGAGSVLREIDDMQRRLAVTVEDMEKKNARIEESTAHIGRLRADIEQTLLLIGSVVDAKRPVADVVAEIEPTVSDGGKLLFNSVRTALEFGSKPEPTKPTESDEDNELEKVLRGETK